MDFNYIKEYITDFDLVKTNFIEVAKDCFKFDGTLNRTKFWTYTLGISVVCFLVNSLVGIIFRGSMIGNILGFVIGVASFVIQVGPCMRRLRDAGKSPHFVWCIFPGVMCCIPPFIPIVFFFFKSVGEEAPAPVAPAEQPAAEQPQDQPPAGN